MDPTIAAFLVQDGIVNGAIYALLALCLVLVFAVTHVVLIPQGEFVAFAALTYDAISDGRPSGAVWLLAALSVAGFLAGLLQERRTAWPRLALECLGLPAIAIGATLILAPTHPGPALAALLAIAVVTPMAPLLYRLAFQRLAQASVLVLLIAAVGVHLALIGTGLLVFGAEGTRGPAFGTARFALGPVQVTTQQAWVAAAALAVMAGLALFFTRTLTGRALRATAINRLGARLVGIETAAAGRMAFAMAGFIGAVSGVLIAPLTTVYFDSGFVIGLKGFVAAIFGGMASYTIAALAAVGVGNVESFASFWASPFKDSIVFGLIIPVLLWRSLSQRAGAGE
jgi:branched-chain amino acid transport system permease protein